MDIDPKHATKASTDIHSSNQIRYLAQLRTTAANYFGFFDQKIANNDNTQPIILTLLEDAWLVLASPEAQAFIDAYDSLLPWLTHSLQHKLHNVLQHFHKFCQTPSNISTVSNNMPIPACDVTYIMDDMRQLIRKWQHHFKHLTVGDYQTPNQTTRRRSRPPIAPKLHAPLPKPLPVAQPHLTPHWPQPIPALPPITGKPHQPP